MDFIKDIKRAIESLPFDKRANAQVFHQAVIDELEWLGCKTWREVPARYTRRRGERCNGRIDVLAAKYDLRIGIECDRNSPRRKSVDKLRGLGWLTHRFVALREPNAGTTGLVSVSRSASDRQFAESA